MKKIIMTFSLLSGLALVAHPEYCGGTYCKEDCPVVGSERYKDLKKGVRKAIKKREKKIKKEYDAQIIADILTQCSEDDACIENMIAARVADENQEMFASNDQQDQGDEPIQE